MHDCEKCEKNANIANQTGLEVIPYVVYECEMAKAEKRAAKCLFWTVVSTAAMILSNLAWMIAYLA